MLILFVCIYLAVGVLVAVALKRIDVLDRDDNLTVPFVLSWPLVLVLAVAIGLIFCIESIVDFIGGK